MRRRLYTGLVDVMAAPPSTLPPSTPAPRHDLRCHSPLPMQGYLQPCRCALGQLG